MRMQQKHGNKFVQRHIADMQREKEESKAAPKESEGGGFGEFISKQVYDAISKELSESKLKGYATQVAGLATDEILKLMNEGQGDPTALEQASEELTKKILKNHLESALKEIFAGPAGQRLRSTLLGMSQDPDKAVGLAILGLAAMVASNAAIPKIKKSFKLGGGASADVSGDFGKFQEIAIKNIGLGLKYSSKHFNSSVSGSYADGKGVSATTQMGANAGPIKGSASATYKSEGEDEGVSGQATIAAQGEASKAELVGKLTPNGDFNIKLGSVFDVENFMASASGTYDSVKGWSGVGELRIGPKESHLSVKQTVNPDSESSLAFGPKINMDLIKAQAMLNMSAEDQTLDASVALKKPFGIQDMEVKAYLLTDLDDGVIKKAGLDGSWQLHHQVDGDGATQSLILLTFDAAFVQSDGEKPAGGQGALLLQGHF